jgi:alkanesulfonate monooxygenase SsuD/methylene tetrahydromethanopterin reductase-like flavin-dependent oxidoreductase (luciferase family)
MEEARDRFYDAYQILKHGLTGETFSYEGKYFSTNREIRIRPTPKSERIHLYGALGSPQSASIMAEMGLAPLNTCQFPFHILEKAMGVWNEHAAARGFPDEARRPVMAHTLMADSDDEALDLARRHLSEFFALQVTHYEADADFWVDIKGYEQFSRFFKNLTRLADPDNIGDFTEHNFVGSPQTVAGQVEKLAAIGFNHIIVHPATVGVPRALRHDVLRRFAETVAPEFSPAFAKAA